MTRFRARTAAVAAFATGAAALSVLPAPTASAAPGHSAQRESHSTHDDLRFDPTDYTTITVTIDGQLEHVRWYKEVCYVANPVEALPTQTNVAGQPMTISNTACGYQSMNVFVPESAADDPETAIYFAVNNGGWWASYVRASVTDGATYDSTKSNVGAALKAGYVFVDVATRSRGMTAADGTWGGKAPSPVVDAKAAVRYLRLNDKRFPGSAERIVVNGTSGGGALTAIIGASGNSPDYYPYLAEIGAAGITAGGRSTIRDDILAANAYCPITDLGNADPAYEWLYAYYGTREKVATSNNDPVDSEMIASWFAAYEKSLSLRNPNGSRLTAKTMIKAISDEVSRSAETFMAAGGTVPDIGDNIIITNRDGSTTTYVNDWIDVDNDAATVISIDMERYLAFVASQATLKTVPAFDAFGVNGFGTTGRTESNLFGTSDQLYSNYTRFSWENNEITGDGVGTDDTGLTWAEYVRSSETIVGDQLDLINPMKYIGTGADTAPYWYVRHGTRDRDTAFTVSINLDRALKADHTVKDVDYQLAWDTAHAGNYDVPEAMAWIADVLERADRA
ncbi:MAG: hypothetical protein M3306_27905 [Actinomycetota bacterium]|nr:hypothetical protein [Actinomycetota bacterium]